MVGSQQLHCLPYEEWLWHTLSSPSLTGRGKCAGPPLPAFLSQAQMSWFPSPDPHCPRGAMFGLGKFGPFSDLPLLESVSVKERSWWRNQKGKLGPEISPKQKNHSSILLKQQASEWRSQTKVFATPDHRTSPTPKWGPCSPPPSAHRLPLLPYPLLFLQ